MTVKRSRRTCWEAIYLLACLSVVGTLRAGRWVVNVVIYEKQGIVGERNSVLGTMWGYCEREYR